MKEIGKVGVIAIVALVAMICLSNCYLLGAGVSVLCILATRLLLYKGREKVAFLAFLVGLAAVCFGTKGIEWQPILIAVIAFFAFHWVDAKALETELDKE